MTDSFATLPQERALAGTAKAPAATVDRAKRRWSPVAVAIWVLFALGTVLFIALARVPIAAGWRRGRSMQVLEIWRLFTLEVAQVAGPFVTPALATALILVVLGSALLGLWLAMSVTTESTTEKPD